MLNFFRKKKKKESVEEADPAPTSVSAPSELKYYAVSRPVDNMMLRTVGVYVGNASDGAVILRLPSFEDEYVNRLETEVEGPFDSINEVIALLSQHAPEISSVVEETLDLLDEEPRTFESEEAERKYYAQRLARKIVADNHPGFEWIGELSHSHINNMSAHICNNAKRAEKEGRVVRTLKGKRAYGYELEFFKSAALAWREHATLKLGYKA